MKSKGEYSQNTSATARPIVQCCQRIFLQLTCPNCPQRTAKLRNFSKSNNLSLHFDTSCTCSVRSYIHMYFFHIQNYSLGIVPASQIEPLPIWRRLQGRRYRVHEYTIVSPWSPETCKIVYIRQRETALGPL